MAHETSYLLGLDVGNTVIKAVLFDTSGRQIAHHAIDGQSSYPAPGQVERDLDELWRNACAAIRAVIEKSGVPSTAIAAIGTAGHGNGLYLLDRAGDPLLGIQSLDNRAASLAARIDAENGAALKARCLQRPWPSQTPTLLAWVKAERPDVYGQIGSVLFCKDFLNYRLTGELRTEISDLSGAGLLSMPDGGLDADLLSLYGLEDALSLIPERADPIDIVGRVTAKAEAATGLAVGTPVIAGFFDVVSSAMGSGACRPGQASIIAGTWSINQVFADTPATDPDLFMVSTFGPNRYVNIESSATSAANLEWYVHRILGSHDAAAFERVNDVVAAVEVRGDDPIFHPYLFGSRLGSEYRGGFYGLAGWHGEGHVLRALFEGVAFEHKRHVGVLRQAGQNVGVAMLSGGGSRSTAWAQIIANALSLPVCVAEARETGALGAAIGAGTAVGLFGSLDEGVTTMTRVVRKYHPEAAMRAHYERRYGLFLELSERMHGFWTKLSAH